MIPQIVILPLLVTQVLSAPSGCIESCGSYVKQYQTQASSNYQAVGDLTQAATRLQALDYNRPGTWTEHNDYNVDSGHGKVHEERGQVVEGPKTVRYYKKNYTSSYSTRYPNGAGLSELELQNNNYGHGVHVPNTEEAFDSQRTYNQIGASESIAQRRYNRIQDQQHVQSSIRRTNAQSERLEDFGEYSGNTQTAQVASDLNTQTSQEPHPTSTTSGNWSKVDSYKTDGGHGRVFEEEGQYVAGAKKVRYYKRNYTSGYSSSSGLPIPEATVAGVHDLHKEIEKIHREIGKEFNQMSTAEHTASSNIAQTNTNTYGLISDNTYRNRINHGNSYHRNEDRYLTDTSSEYIPRTNPSQNTYGTNSYSMYERHEGRVRNLQPTSQLINPTSGYTNVLSTGNSGYSSNIHDARVTQQQIHNLDQTEVSDRYQSKHLQNQMIDDSLRKNMYNQNSGIYPGTPGQVTHYKEHQSHSQTRETFLPQYSRGTSQISEDSTQYNTHQYGHQHNAHQTMQENDYMQQYGRNNFNSAHQRLGTQMTGALDLGHGHDTVDCEFGTAEHSHTSSQYQRKYKRSINQNKLSGMQQPSSPDAFTQQTAGNLEFGQQSQHSDDPWELRTSNQQSEDLTQQTGNFDDLTQQTSGKLEFGQQTQHPYQPQKPGTRNQHSEDLTQQTGDFDDLTQQTSGKLEFGSQLQQQSQKPGSQNQYSDDMTQQTDQFNDFTQQTSGKLEFGQQTQHPYQPQKPGTSNQHLEDLTQQTGDFDDLTQQTSGKLEFGSQLQQQAQKPGSQNQYSDDMTQQTDQFNDFTQQTSGKLEFGQQTQHPYQPQKPGTSNQHLEDLTQQTGDFDDLTQQTSGKLEFGSQLQQQSQRPGSHNQYPEDLTQQTGDLIQQTSGKLELGQQTQHTYQPQKPGTSNYHLEDLTQTGEFDDLTQQTSGKLEFGPQSQHPHQPQKPGSRNQYLEDMTQQTGDFDDLTQQTSGKLEFGQQTQDSYQPWKPATGNQHLEDLTQQTGEFDDFTQQTSGKLEFGQQTQHNQPQKPKTDNQRLGHLAQQTDEFEDLTQQASGKLEFGPQSQHSYQPQKPGSPNQYSGGMAQQTGDFDDLTQQTSGKLEFGQQSQYPHQPQKPRSSGQHLEDLTQQTSGMLEFGSQSQHSYQPQKPGSRNQYSEGMAQQTGNFDDLTQQTSGKLEFGQQTQDSYQPWKPGTGNQHSEDLTQQTGNFDDLTQQTSGKLEFGQQSQSSYHPWKPSNQHSEDLTQQVGEFDDLTQQTSGKIGFGQFGGQYNEDLSALQHGSTTQLPKPAEKPKPRSRYSRRGSVNNLQAQNQATQNTVNQQNELPPKVLPEAEIGNIRSQNIRGDQGLGNPTDKDISKNVNENFGDFGFGNEDQDRLHKSNDATVGVQWHYTYHPSDHRHFVQQRDQKEKDDSQQQLTYPEHPLLHVDQQHALEDLYLQSSSQYNGESGLNQQSQKFGYDQETEFGQKMSDDTQKGQFELSQQATGHTKDQQKSPQNGEMEHKLEPRILEAYGGGPYDASHSDDIYSGVRVNPSATLPPIYGADPWDVREKPREMHVMPGETTPPPMPVKPLGTETNEATPPPSFWSRIGNKITNSFDKAKEKARTIFG